MINNSSRRFTRIRKEGRVREKVVAECDRVLRRFSLFAGLNDRVRIPTRVVLIYGRNAWLFGKLDVIR